MNFLQIKNFLTVFTTTVLVVTLLSGCAGAVVVGVGAGVGVIHDRRSAGTVVEDQAIEFKAASRIRRDKSLKKRSHINITSYNRVVLITGETATKELRDYVGNMISQVPNVKKIHNELTVGPSTSTGSRLRDTWITTKAKTTLFKIKKKGFDPTRIKIVTENNSVYLLGLVTPDEGNAAVDRIKLIKGVTRVVKIFEYITRSPAKTQAQSHTETPAIN